MEITLCNPQKGRLETIDVELTKDHTTCFTSYRSPPDIWLITDFQGGLVVREFNYTYPVRVYETLRAEIG